jgi:hypothetical protein
MIFFKTNKIILITYHQLIIREVLKFDHSKTSTRRGDIETKTCLFRLFYTNTNLYDYIDLSFNYRIINIFIYSS